MVVRFTSYINVLLKMAVPQLTIDLLNNGSGVNYPKKNLDKLARHNNYCFHDINTFIQFIMAEQRLTIEMLNNSSGIKYLKKHLDKLGKPFKNGHGLITVFIRNECCNCHMNQNKMKTRDGSITSYLTCQNDSSQYSSEMIITVFIRNDCCHCHMNQNKMKTRDDSITSYLTCQYDSFKNKKPNS
ncbi:hypothetical protein AGLY_009013 [Aphis glycines]|uniref:Uncharacterized protein n=1 Tax=Aphis glycines TaxID=307491 RepID=A0A6G0TIR4_APHGL|nr:hypothetical protein AGLY_009013 [Aphis glycines]